MDPRMIDVLTFDQQTDEELARPPAWRYGGPCRRRGGWACFGNWYSQMLQGQCTGCSRMPCSTRHHRRRTPGANALRRRCADHQVLVPPVQEADEGAPEIAEGRPVHSWKISPLDWQQSKTYDRFVRFGERVLRRTSRDYAPWHIVEGSTPTTVAWRSGASCWKACRPRWPTTRASTRGTWPHWGVASMTAACWGRWTERAPGQGRLPGTTGNRAGPPRRAAAGQRMRRHALVAVFEGNDAAGKGGAIRRVAAALDPASTVSCRLPRPPKKSARSLLWRFWRHIPARASSPF